MKHDPAHELADEILYQWTSLVLSSEIVRKQQLVNIIGPFLAAIDPGFSVRKLPPRPDKDDDDFLDTPVRG